MFDFAARSISESSIGSLKVFHQSTACLLLLDSLNFGGRGILGPDVVRPDVAAGKGGREREAQAQAGDGSRAGSHGFVFLPSQCRHSPQ